MALFIVFIRTKQRDRVTMKWVITWQKWRTQFCQFYFLKSLNEEIDWKAQFEKKLNAWISSTVCSLEDIRHRYIILCFISCHCFFFNDMVLRDLFASIKERHWHCVKMFVFYYYSFLCLFRSFKTKDPLYELNGFFIVV